MVVVMFSSVSSILVLLLSPIAGLWSLRGKSWFCTFQRTRNSNYAKTCLDIWSTYMGQCALWNGGKKQYECHLCLSKADYKIYLLAWILISESFMNTDYSFFRLYWPRLECSVFFFFKITSWQCDWFSLYRKLYWNFHEMGSKREFRIMLLTFFLCSFICWTFVPIAEVIPCTFHTTFWFWFSPL